MSIKGLRRKLRNSEGKWPWFGDEYDDRIKVANNGDEEKNDDGRNPDLAGIPHEKISRPNNRPLRSTLMFI